MRPGVRWLEHICTTLHDMSRAVSCRSCEIDQWSMTHDRICSTPSFDTSCTLSSIHCHLDRKWPFVQLSSFFVIQSQIWYPLGISRFLVLDPHYTGRDELKTIVDKVRLVSDPRPLPCVWPARQLCMFLVSRPAPKEKQSGKPSWISWGVVSMHFMPVLWPTCSKNIRIHKLVKMQICNW